MDLGQRIKKARKNKGLTQEQLAKECQLATITIRQYELGKRNPSISQIAQIAMILGIRMEDLVGMETFDSGEEFQKRWNEITSNHSNKQVTIIHKADGTQQIVDHQQEHLLFTYVNLDKDDQDQLVKYGDLLAGQPKYKESPQD